MYVSSSHKHIGGHYLVEAGIMLYSAISSKAEFFFDNNHGMLENGMQKKTKSRTIDHVP